MRPGILRLLHLREQTEAVGETMAIERQRFDAIRDREPTRAVAAFNLFQTPATIAGGMVDQLGPLDGLRILEPSAGLGRLYRAIRDRSRTAETVLVEQSPQCCGELYRSIEGDDRARLVQDDFLAQSVDQLGLFDAVVMNPPFKMGRDVKHIRHAFNLLNPGGLLVALCFNGTRQADLRDLVTSWEVLPADSFKSEGTRASVAMITWRKPLTTEGN